MKDFLKRLFGGTPKAENTPSPKAQAEAQRIMAVIKEAVEANPAPVAAVVNETPPQDVPTRRILTHRTLAENTPPSFDAATLKLGIEFMEEYVSKCTHKYRNQIKLSDLSIWKTIKSEPTEKQVDLCLWAFRGNWEHADTQTDILVGKTYNASEAKEKLGATLIRSKLPYSDVQLTEFLKHCLSLRSLEWDNPILTVLGHVERALGGAEPTGDLNAALTRVQRECRNEYSSTEKMRKMEKRLNLIFNPHLASAAYELPPGDWAELVGKDLAAMDDVTSAKWMDLFEHASSGTGSKPSQKWLKTGAGKIEPIGADAFNAKLSHWMAQTKIDPARPDNAVDLIKGLVWLTVNHPTESIALAVGRFAESCYVKITNYGARSKKLGNACFSALMLMPDNPTAIAQLVRLREKIKYPSVRKMLEKKLNEIARKKGLTLEQLEDESLPSFEFDVSGRRVETLGEYIATLTLNGAKAELSWANKAGKPRKSVPAAVKADFKSELKELRQLTKDVTAILAGQARTLDQSYVTDRSWPFAAWTQQYLEHPLRAKITKSLIWEVTEDKKTTAFLPTDKGLEDISGKVFKPSKTAELRLWHPLHSSTKEILAWRKKIEARALVQPFKQAHREVYVVTDAERGTDIYSNRFAAHILRQHQFKALCAARGWAYRLQGMWDSHNVPTRIIAAHNIKVEFAVNMIGDAEVTESGIPLYLNTDQVRFHQNQTEMRMENIPPIIFSEAMRDVDLFVAVTSVASDPNWTDGGPDGRFGQYWRGQAFGELGETAKTRKEIIADLVPKLALADKVEIGEKVLKVQGKRHEYHIHFGSGNIMIMPGNKYLCIVSVARNSKEDKIYLPFAGDTLASTIISKAQLLVNDDKITDRTILSQL